MNNFEQEYNKLNDVSKMAVNAYRSGRQFMMTGIRTSGAGIVINNRLYSTIIASVVNEVFACELFLKSMIMIKTGEKSIKKHKLLELYDLLGIETIEKSLSKYDFRDELQKISCSFITWRYCYEYGTIVINRGFVFELCNVLENENKKIIFKEYNLNMDQSFI